MDRVRSGLCHDVDHACSKSAELRAVAIRDDTEFLHGIGIWQRISGVPKSRGVIATVEVIADRSRSSGRTIDHANLGRASQRVCRIRLIHAGRECEKRVKIAIHEREREDLLVIDGVTHAGVRVFTKGASPVIETVSVTPPTSITGSTRALRFTSSTIPI